MTGVWPRSWPGPSSGSQFGAPHYWGEAHLALDAVVAYVDDELSDGARNRALDHLSQCRDCGAEVVAQYQARSALRGAAAPAPSSSLLHSLRAIPQSAELPEPPAGLAVGPDGQFVALLREQQQPSMDAPQGQPNSRRFATGRRVRLGAGVMVSGLALGALVIGATPTPTGAAGAGAGAGAARTALDAQLQLGGAGVARVSPSPTPTPTPSLVPARR